MSLRRVSARLLGMLLVVGAGVTMGAAPASASTLCGTYVIFNRSANHFVSAEYGRYGWEYGLLRARADAVGQWEEFYICQEVGSGWGRIHSTYHPVNNPLWSVDLNMPGEFDGAVAAGGNPADGIQYREEFRIVAVGGGYYSFLSRTANKYLIAETGYAGAYDGMLRAASSTNSSYRTHFRILDSPLS